MVQPTFPGKSPTLLFSRAGSSA